jgi:phosphoribosylaminoimidazole-succinocarboxamide synthase
VTGTLHSMALPHLHLFRSGKVRDTYLVDDALLMVASDRISAFDVILPSSIPRKGIVLTQLSRFWFDQTRSSFPNHMITADASQFPDSVQEYTKQLNGRAMLVRMAERIDIECVVRGYVAGSAWKEYREHGTIASAPIEQTLQQSGRLAEPIFTPAIKADSGHDENISRGELRDRIGVELANELERASLSIYELASDFAIRRGIVIADTKFEFGFIDGELTLIDEVLTPDSSRFWDAAKYRPGQEQESFDKQFVRNWLEGTGWDKTPPGPDLPLEVVSGTAERYHEAYKRITGSALWLALE